MGRVRILITGGSGRLGRELVPLLSAAGHSVRILSRVKEQDSTYGCLTLLAI